MLLEVYFILEVSFGRGLLCRELVWKDIVFLIDRGVFVGVVEWDEFGN